MGPMWYKSTGVLISYLYMYNVIMIINVFAVESHFDLACKVGVFWVSERHSFEQTGMFFRKQPRE